MKSQSSKIEDDVDLLWIDLREGARSGLEGLYKRFAKQLFHYGLSIVSDQDFVQDCIQEVFIDLWKYHKNLQKADNVKLYLYRSLSHKMFKADKREKKWKRENINDHLESSFFIESQETELIVVQGEEILKKKLAVALKELPLRQKEVIQYLFFENFSYEEVSRLMGINLRSVYTLAWKAVSNLKKVMGFDFYIFKYLSLSVICIVDFSWNFAFASDKQMTTTSAQSKIILKYIAVCF